MKKRWKKLLVTVLACCLIVSALAGCGSSSSSSDSSSASGDDSASSTDEIVELTVMFPVVGSTPADLELVEDAINEITEAELGIHITYYPVSFFDIESELTRMAAAGESIDIAFVDSVSSYVSNGLIAPLDDLLDEYGQDIVDAMGMVLEGGSYDGQIYSIYNGSRYADTFGFTFRKDILDKYGLSLDDGEYLTYEILDSWFEIIKEGEGDSFYMFSNTGTSTYGILEMMVQADHLGGELYTGVLLDYEGDSDDYTVTNFFESDAFAEYQYWMNKWYEAGYINPDSATMSETGTSLMVTGNYLCIGGAYAGSEEEYTNNWGFEAVSYYFSDAKILMQNYSGGFVISSTSENQEAAMKYLNYAFTSEELNNLMCIGIEGTHYVTTDEEGIVTYPDGVDSTSVAFSGGQAINVSLVYSFSPVTTETREEIAEFNESIVSGDNDYDISKAYGYVFNQTEVKTEIAAISDVIAEYASAILYGSQDPDESIPALNEALYAAGLDKVLEENQSQLDAWLAEQ